MQPCLYCGGDRHARDHDARCDGRQGAIEALDAVAFPEPPACGLTPETWVASAEAAIKVEPSAETLRALVLAHIRRCGESGATDDEIQAALDLSGNTERPRRWELFKADLIHASGHRVNARGRRCAVWCATANYREARTA